MSTETFNSFPAFLSIQTPFSLLKENTPLWTTTLPVITNSDAHVMGQQLTHTDLPKF
jgi:hypothetical protein